MIKKNPTVTIAVVAYNEEHNIKAFLESVLAQKERGFRLGKILVISDGSSDNTVKIAKAIGSKYIEVKAYAKRLGKSSRLNEIYQNLATAILVQSDADVIFKHAYVVREMVKVLTLKDGPAMCGGDPTPMTAKNFVEEAVNCSVALYRKVRRVVGGGNNIFSADGRLLGFRKVAVSKLTIPKNMIASDAFAYLWCKSHGFRYAFVPEAQVLFRSPQTITDQLKQNTRFLAAQTRMRRFFPKKIVENEYYIPRNIWVQGALEQCLEKPAHLLFIFVLNRICWVRAAVLESKLDAKWQIALTTKKLRLSW